MNKFKLVFAICMVLMMAVACSSIDENKLAATAAEMLAEEIGFAVADNNPELADKALAYYETLQGYYNDENFDLLAIAVEDGISILCAKYIPEPSTAMRVKSKIVRLMELSGLEASTDIPGAEKLQELAPEYVMSIVDAFMGGVKMAQV